METFPLIHPKLFWTNLPQSSQPKEEADYGLRYVSPLLELQTLLTHLLYPE